MPIILQVILSKVVSVCINVVVGLVLLVFFVTKIITRPLSWCKRRFILCVLLLSLLLICITVTYRDLHEFI